MSSDGNSGNVIGGHKATLSNQHVGAEAKAHSAKVLEEEYGINVTKSGDEYTVEDDSSSSGDKNVGNVIGGHKANLKNANTSEESKEHSEEVLSGLEDDGSNTSTEHTTESGEHEKDPANVERGLKATLSNPRTSDEAKERAQERLDTGDY